MASNVLQMADPEIASARRIKVVEVTTAIVHELPGDAATRDARTLAYFSYPSGAVVPLVFRGAGEMFYVAGDRAAEFAGKLLRRAG